MVTKSGHFPLAKAAYPIHRRHISLIPILHIEIRCGIILWILHHSEQHQLRIYHHHYTPSPQNHIFLIHEWAGTDVRQATKSKDSQLPQIIPKIIKFLQKMEPRYIRTDNLDFKTFMIINSRTLKASKKLARHGTKVVKNLQQSVRICLSYTRPQTTQSFKEIC